MPLSNFSGLKKIAKGSFGVVFKATRKSDGEVYAVKKMCVSLMSKEEQTEALNEVRILASVMHHNVLRFCEAFIEDDYLYIVTEYCEGGDLMDFIKRYRKSRGSVPEAQVWAVFTQIAIALKALHDAHILHRDLKPQNILLTGNYRVKVGDLGCAKLIKDRRGMAQTQLGTPYYMSPEVWRNEPYGKKSDVWGLGCILFQLCTGRPPFNGKSMHQLSLQVVSGKSVPQVPTHYSLSVSSLVGRMLQRDPEERPSIDTILAWPSVRAQINFMGDEYTIVNKDAKFLGYATINVRRSLEQKAPQLPKPAYRINKSMESPSKQVLLRSAETAGGVETGDALYDFVAEFTAGNSIAAPARHEKHLKPPAPTRMRARVLHEPGLSAAAGTGRRARSRRAPLQRTSGNSDATIILSKGGRKGVHLPKLPVASRRSGRGDALKRAAARHMAHRQRPPRARVLPELTASSNFDRPRRLGRRTAPTHHARALSNPPSVRSPDRTPPQVKPQALSRRQQARPHSTPTSSTPKHRSRVRHWARESRQATVRQTTVRQTTARQAKIGGGGRPRFPPLPRAMSYRASAFR